MFVETTATKKIFSLDKRLRCVQGGTSASKTISILIWLIQTAQMEEDLLISVVSESFPHLKRGAIRDFLNILQSHNYFKDDEWNKTDFTYTFKTGSKIEFFSADQPGKVRGPRRDILFINEANNIDYEIYDQLAIRTKNVIFLDWNPVSEFWYYDKVKNTIDHNFITLTYLDNEALDQSIITEIESRKMDKNWWRVYGLGQLGEVEGRVYKDWQLIDEIPHEARLEGYGLDFGYSVDESAIVAIYYHNGGYILDEITYQKGLSNKELADIFKNIPKGLVIADCAEPKSIDEIKSFGINIIPCQKGKDSVEYGVQFVQGLRISASKRSLNLIKEYRNFLHDKDDKTGKFIQGKYEGKRHALDAARYRLTGIQPARDPNTIKPLQLGTIPISGGSKMQPKILKIGR